jgi:ribosome biogenesis GTPase / thiamine phosphate phosphatase
LEKIKWAPFPYLKLKAESEFNEMSYVDRRKKDKEFGKIVKSVLKDRRK